MRRTFLAVIVALIFYAVVDIMVWQRIFETNKMFEYADQYHNGWFIMLIAETGRLSLSSGFICKIMGTS